MVIKGTELTKVKYNNEEIEISVRDSILFELLSKIAFKLKNG